MKKIVFRFSFEGDTFEVTLRGYIIARITCYYSGGQRQDVQYDDIPEGAQLRILAKVEDEVNGE